MKTIPNRWSRSWRGDYSATCDICGVRWRRSQLSRKADGLLYCPDDKDGRDAVTLSELNAARATEGFDTFNDRDGALDGDVYTPFALVPVDLTIIALEQGLGFQLESGGEWITEDSGG